MSRRTDRLDEQFREEIGKLLQKGLKDELRQGHGVCDGFRQGKA